MKDDTLELQSRRDKCGEKNNLKCGGEIAWREEILIHIKILELKQLTVILNEKRNQSYVM